MAGRVSFRKDPQWQGKTGKVVCYRGIISSRQREQGTTFVRVLGWERYSQVLATEWSVCLDQRDNKNK